MLNQVVLVGRIFDVIEVEENKGHIVLATNRSYKNENGEYETDFIPCILTDGILLNVKEYCHKGDLVGIKGRLQANGDTIELIAERVTFLANKKTEEEK